VALHIHSNLKIMVDNKHIIIATGKGIHQTPWNDHALDSYGMLAMGGMKEWMGGWWKWRDCTLTRLMDYSCRFDGYQKLYIRCACCMIIANRFLLALWLLSKG
jgi:hypothetical protein